MSEIFHHDYQESPCYKQVLEGHTAKHTEHEINVATAAAPVAVIVVFNKFGNKPVIRSS